jgi:hypothetical protein
MTRATLAGLALVAVTVAGCGTASPGRGGATSPHERCRVDPYDSGPRPIVLFCIESP